MDFYFAIIYIIFVKEITYVAFSLLIILIIFDNLQNVVNYIMFALPFSFIFQFTSIIMFICAVLVAFIKFYVIYFFKEKGKMKLLPLLFCLIFLV